MRDLSSKRAEVMAVTEPLTAPSSKVTSQPGVRVTGPSNSTPVDVVPEVQDHDMGPSMSRAPSSPRRSAEPNALIWSAMRRPSWPKSTAPVSMSAVYPAASSSVVPSSVRLAP